MNIDFLPILASVLHIVKYILFVWIFNIYVKLMYYLGKLIQIA